MSYRIEVAEKAALFRDDRVLLLWLDAYRGYQLPGGRLDEGERAGAGLIREIREETGFEMKRDAFTLYHTAIFCPDAPKYGVFFHADAPQGVVELSDHESYVWASKDEVEALPFVFEEVKNATLEAFDARNE